MTVDIHSEEARIIRQLIPLSTLPTKRFEHLCKQLHIETAESGQYLFRRGDDNSDLYFLLDGSISLQTESFIIETIRADSDSARFAIAHQIPRKVDAVAKSRIQFLRLNTAMMKSTQETSYQENESTMMVDELEDNDDWMTTLLKSPIFRGLPPANLQKILMSLQEIRFNPGEIIIKQGDPGDYYYIIKKGQALISRKPAPTAKEIKLAQLGDLDTFGEDSLLSGDPRNVTITAMTPMCLLRLGKEQFITLIKQPTLSYIQFEDLHAQLADGAELIDVRGPDEFQKSHLPHSINVPFFSLRMYLKTLSRNHPTIVVCKDGRTSESAAFVLMRHKFKALILKGGIAALTDDQLKAAPALFKIDESLGSSQFFEQSSEPPTTSSMEPVTQSQSVALDLRLVLQQLKAKCAALEAEKMTLELKCSSLARQLNATKSELEKLKGG
jgi:CRP-like cAMP-binding protein